MGDLLKHAASCRLFPGTVEMGHKCARPAGKNCPRRAHGPMSLAAVPFAECERSPLSLVFKLLRCLARGVPLEIHERICSFDT